MKKRSRSNFRRAAPVALTVSRPRRARRSVTRVSRPTLFSRVRASGARKVVHMRRMRTGRRRTGLGGMKIMGLNLVDIVSFVAGAVAGVKAPRVSMYQDPAIFVGGAVLGSGFLGGSNASVGLIRNAALGYVAGTVGQAVFATKTGEKEVTGTHIHFVGD